MLLLVLELRSSLREPFLCIRLWVRRVETHAAPWTMDGLLLALVLRSSLPEPFLCIACGLGGSRCSQRHGQAKMLGAGLLGERLPAQGLVITKAAFTGRPPGRQEQRR